MHSISKVMIIGKNGNLGAAFLEVHPEMKDNAISYNDLLPDIKIKLKALLRERNIEVVINCAAHTNAEQGEGDRYLSYKSNTLFPSLLAQVCNDMNVKLVHFSSTGVYGKWKDTPYCEYDLTSPTTVHHKSKLMGEQEVLNNSRDALIIRTGWLFGGTPSNSKSFVWDRIEEAKDKPFIESDSSQYGNPTWVKDVVRQTERAIEEDCRGVFNCVSKPHVSRYEYVSEILRLSGSKISVHEVDGSHFRRKAPVSWNEMAENFKFELMGLDVMPDWRVSMDAYIKELEECLGGQRYE